MPSYWTSLPLLLYLLGVYSIPFAALVCAIVFGVPALRRKRAARTAGFASLALAATCPLGLAVSLMLAAGVQTFDIASLANRHHHLTKPEIFFGTTYPAGSVVVVNEKGDALESGTLSQPTVVEGVPLIGDFTRSAGDGPSTTSVSGVLATDTMLHTAPCAGRSKATYAVEYVNCILAHDVTLNGLPLAGGTYVALRKDVQNDDFVLQQGALSAPVLLFGTVYPARTVVAPDYASVPAGTETLADLLRQPVDPHESGIRIVCLQPGATVPLEDAVLHGPLGINYMADRTDVSTYCAFRIADQDVPAGEDGFITRGTQTFRDGGVDAKSHTWKVYE